MADIVFQRRSELYSLPAHETWLFQNNPRGTSTGHFNDKTHNRYKTVSVTGLSHLQG